MISLSKNLLASAILLQFLVNITLLCTSLSPAAAPPSERRQRDQSKHGLPRLEGKWGRALSPTSLPAQINIIKHYAATSAPRPRLLHAERPARALPALITTRFQKPPSCRTEMFVERRGLKRLHYLAQRSFKTTEPGRMTSEEPTGKLTELTLERLD